MARETVMIELEEPITSSDGKPATPAQEADFIRETLDGTALPAPFALRRSRTQIVFSWTWKILAATSWT